MKRLSWWHIVVILLGLAAAGFIVAAYFTFLSAPKRALPIAEATPTAAPPTVRPLPAPSPTPFALVTPVPTPGARPTEAIPAPENPFSNGLPEPSAQCSLQLLETSGENLGELRDHFVAALAKANYSAYAVYPYGHGFALITRVEKCEKDGSIAKDRWANLDQTELPLSKVLTYEYWRQLFRGRTGDYRFFVFAFTGEPLKITAKETTASEAAGWQAKGSPILPLDQRDAKINYPFFFSVLVYEFSSAGDSTVFLRPQNAVLGAWEELEGSKIVPSWNKLSFPPYIAFEVDHVALKESNESKEP